MRVHPTSGRSPQTFSSLRGSTPAPQSWRRDALSAVEHRPADVVPQPLVVEYELANRLRELVALPPVLESACALTLSFRRGSACGLDRIGGRTEFVCDGRGLASSVRGMRSRLNPESFQAQICDPLSPSFEGRDYGFFPRDRKVVMAIATPPLSAPSSSASSARHTVDFTAQTLIDIGFAGPGVTARSSPRGLLPARVRVQLGVGGPAFRHQASATARSLGTGCPQPGRIRDGRCHRRTRWNRSSAAAVSDLAGSPSLVRRRLARPARGLAGERRLDTQEPPAHSGCRARRSCSPILAPLHSRSWRRSSRRNSAGVASPCRACR